MKVDFHVQDPSNPETTYLYESILESVEGAAHWVGMYAFASRNGVDQLVSDSVVHDYLSGGGGLDLVVGLDAVTDRAALLRLEQAGAAYAGLQPKIFWNDSSALFHPKLSLFHYPDGAKRLIVGSGNLTPGGMQKNFEAFTVVTSAAGEHLDTTCFEEFLERHVENVRDIDDRAHERAARNRFIRRARTARPSPALVADEAGGSAVLVADVPAAGDRWSQVHFNKDVIEAFFKVRRPRTERVYLRRLAERGLHEEVRPVVYSKSNKNFKIEIAAAKHLAYPPNGRPILVMVERAARAFDYMLLMPGDVGHAQMDRLMDNRPSIGKGLRRIRTDLRDLHQSWPGCPLLRSIQADSVSE
jgi:hypothetical protein